MVAQPVGTSRLKLRLEVEHRETFPLQQINVETSLLVSNCALTSLCTAKVKDPSEKQHAKHIFEWRGDKKETRAGGL